MGSRPKDSSPTFLECLYLRDSTLLNMEYGAVSVHTTDGRHPIPVVDEALRRRNALEHTGRRGCARTTHDEDSPLPIGVLDPQHNKPGARYPVVDQIDPRRATPRRKGRWFPSHQARDLVRAVHAHGASRVAC